MAFLAEARDDPSLHAASLLAASDWCLEERGEVKLAEGLRKIVELECRPFYHATSCGWRWYAGQTCTRQYLTKEVARRLKGFTYGLLPQTGVTESASNPKYIFAHYSNFAGAILALAHAVTTKPQPQVMNPEEPEERESQCLSS